MSQGGGWKDAPLDSEGVLAAILTGVQERWKERKGGHLEGRPAGGLRLVGRRLLQGGRPAAILRRHAVLHTHDRQGDQPSDTLANPSLSELFPQ